MYIITRLQRHVKIYFSLGTKKPNTWAGFKKWDLPDIISFRISYLVHQLHMRACLREQKSYGLEVLAICNAYTLSLGGVLLINLASSEYYCIYFTRL